MNTYDLRFDQDVGPWSFFAHEERPQPIIPSSPPASNWFCGTDRFYHAEFCPHLDWCESVLPPLPSPGDGEALANRSKLWIIPGGWTN